MILLALWSEIQQRSHNFAKEFVARLEEIPDGCADCFPFDLCIFRSVRAGICILRELCMFAVFSRCE